MDKFFTLQLLVKLIASFIGAGAFAVVFKANKRHVLFGALNGLVTYFIYYTVIFFINSSFAAAFISTAVAAVIAEIFARLRRAPSSVFLIPGVIPTVPGGNLYLFVRYLLESKLTDSLAQLFTALSIALGIAMGTVIVSISWGIIRDKVAKRKSNKIQT